MPPGCAHTPRKRATAGRTLRAAGAVWRGSGRPPARRAAARQPGRPPVGAGVVSSRFRYAASLRSSASRAALSHDACPSFRPRAGGWGHAPACVCEVTWPPAVPVSFPPSRATRPLLPSAASDPPRACVACAPRRRQSHSRPPSRYPPWARSRKGGPKTALESLTLSDSRHTSRSLGGWLSGSL